MHEPLVIDLEQLRAAVVGALDGCEKQLGPRIAVERDCYWHLPIEAALDMTVEPTELTVGQLRDDLQAISVPGQPETAWHDLAHAIGVLRALEALVRP